MITIDGSHGEGGGQILRTSLALSILTGQPVRFENIRAGRSRPGLQRQHLMAVQAAATISQAAMSGAALHSQTLTFSPQPAKAGEYRFDIGSAGSTTLVLQTVLPPLVLADGPSSLELIGGTHNPWAPAYESMAESFLPLVNRMGPQITATLEAHGFAPAGQGRVRVSIEPASHLKPLTLDERGPVTRRFAEAVVANLPVEIAQRELRVLQEHLHWPKETLQVREATNSAGPGNVLLVRVESEHVTEVVAVPGQKGLRAEAVASIAADQVLRYLRADVPVGEHLADQLLLPLSLAGSGSFLTLPLTEHSRTNMEIIRRFLPVSFAVEERGPEQVHVRISS